ncbi:uncharacterized protein DUF4169 [Litoreibacter ponti]|uniref:Uncharacterized protein DUF4169 n=1 Tax=Litoreibacter ponti TaxID=1510457 RepID=A0A2T6BJG1_9RHOB|nr:DUF4169 family protein [Litoreibacter ponti]PTX56199.1 uncharacterized protein DUF4169 [Litoreibacter ponti]
MKPINLNQKRKERARAEKKARADANSVKFGRTKSEKSEAAALTKLEARKLDGHKRDE